MRRRRGVTLIEVIVALSILAATGLATLGLLRQVLASIEHAQAQSVRAEVAAAFLDVVMLWPASELDLHLGGHDQGPWRLEVQRPRPGLYRLVLTDSANVIRLETGVYHPEQR